MNNNGEALVKRSRRRRRSPTRQKLLDSALQSPEPDNIHAHSPSEGASAHLEEASVSSPKEDFLVFSEVLRHLLKGRREAIARLARELEVTETTIYRWLKGEYDPRPIHLRRLLDALPEHRQQLLLAIQYTYPGVLDIPAPQIGEVQKDLYRRVMELVEITSEVDIRRWQVAQAIFDYALVHLDTERQGIALTYAQLMPEYSDGIHSLYEVMMCGSPPWPVTFESHVYLGSTTLAGMTVMSQHMQTWDDLEASERSQVDVDVYERSVCAYPVIRAGQIAGALVISSTQPRFFANSITRQCIVEYARLLSLAFRDDEFKPFSSLNLKPMPAVSWQRMEIVRSYIPRVIAGALQRGLSRHEAEMVVRGEMEMEFEELVRTKGRWPDTNTNEHTVTSM